MNSLFILDNGLRYTYGHHLSYSLGVSDIFKSFGNKNIKILAHEDFKADDLLRAEISPYFRHWLYSEETEKALWEHIEDLRGALLQVPVGATVFVPNVLTLELQALSEVLKIREFSTRRYCIHIRYGKLFSNLTTEQCTLSLIRSLSDNCPKLKFLTDTTAIHRKLLSVTRRAEIIGFPQSIPFGTVRLTSDFNFGYLGQALRHKGFFDLLAALRFGSQIGFTPKVCVQCSDLTESAVKKLTGDPLLENVFFLGRTLDNSEFYSLIGSIRTVVNVYDPLVYQIGSSGILLEALALRRRVIVSDYPWARELLGDDFVRRTSVRFNAPSELLHRMIWESKQEFEDQSLVASWDKARKRLNKRDFFDILMG